MAFRGFCCGACSLTEIPFRIPSAKPPAQSGATGTARLFGKTATVSYALEQVSFGTLFFGGLWGSDSFGKKPFVSGSFQFPGGIDFRNAVQVPGGETVSGFVIRPTISLLGSTRLFPKPGGFGQQTSLGFILQAKRQFDSTANTFFTAWSNVASFGGTPVGPQYPMVGSLDPNDEDKEGLYNSPVQIIGENVTLFRDGVEVFSGTNPTPQQGLDSTQEDGSYFLVSQATSGAVGQPYLKDYASFAISSTQPAIAFVPPDDVYQHPSEYAGVDVPSGLLFANKQVFGYDELIGEPFPFVFILQGGNEDSNHIWPGIEGENLSADGRPTGTFQLTIRRQNKKPIKDIFGNLPAYVPVIPWTVHPIPANDRLGARPKLEGIRKAGFIHPRTSPVQFIDLVYDRKVKASQVTSSQFDFQVNGTSQGIQSLAQIDDYRWRAFLPAGPQSANTTCYLFYNPSGTFTDDLTVEEYPHRAAFPLPSASKYRVTYVDRETEKRYTKAPLSVAPTGYLEIAQGSPPLDRNQVPYGPEPCRLVARTAWVMAAAQPVPRRIDLTPSYSPWAIGGIVSVGGSAAPDLDDGTDIKVVDSTGLPLTSSLGERIASSIVVDPDTGEVTQSEPRGHRIFKERCVDEFSPGVPTTSQPNSDWSWFGLETTIDPASPRRLSSCAVPRTAQRHSSAIRSEDEISGFTITGPGGSSSLLATALSGGVAASSTIDGDLMPQNFWRGSAGVSGQVTVEVPNQINNGVETIHHANHVHLLVNAHRAAKQYKSLGTTVLGKLAIRVKAALWVRVQRTQYISGGTNTGGFGGSGGSSGDSTIPLPDRWIFYPTVEFSTILSGSQEQDLASGSPVPIFPELLSGLPETGWTIQKV